MTVFVDASAMVALLAREPEADALAQRLDQDDDRRTSAVALWETAVVLCRNAKLAPREAFALVSEFLTMLDIAVDPIDGRTAVIALEAFEAYGKGRHPAALNMGDCFAYACAKTSGGALLYKGQDFAKTDLS